MSRHSTPATDLGRLTIGNSNGSSNSGRMPPLTRAMAKGGSGGAKRSLPPSSSSSSAGARSRAGTGPAQRSHKSVRAATPATAGPSRLSGSKMLTPGKSPGGPGGDDDDDEDDDGDDDDEDDDDDENVEEDDDDDDDDGDGDDASGDEDSNNSSDRSAADPAARRALLLAVFSPFDPEHSSYHELLHADSAGRGSKFVDLVGAVAELCRDRAQVSLLANSIGGIKGEYWSQVTATSMNQRVRRIFADFDRWANDQSYTSTNVDSTISAIFAFFSAVDGTLTQFKDMLYCDSLITLLIWAAERVIAYDRDVREQRPGPQRVYAGGATHYEHNLFLRFTSSDMLDKGFWGIILNQATLHADAMRAAKNQLLIIWQVLTNKIKHESEPVKANYASAGVMVFAQRWQEVLFRLGVLQRPQ